MEKANRFIKAFVTFAILSTLYMYVQTVAGSKFDFTTSIDLAIPFIPETIWIYITNFLLMLYAIFAIENFNDILIGSIMAVLISVLCFIYFPSDYPRELYPITEGFYGWAFSVLRSTDMPNNTFPSLHISLTWLLTVSLIKESKKKCINIYLIIYTILLSLSVLTTKQHFIADVFGGIAVAWLSLMIAKRVNNEDKRFHKRSI